MVYAQDGGVSSPNERSVTLPKSDYMVSETRVRKRRQDWTRCLVDNCLRRLIPEVEMFLQRIKRGGKY